MQKQELHKDLNMNEEQEFREKQRIFEEARKRTEEKYKENSKKKLLMVLEKKFKTTMIGALARFESSFGELWGHGEEDLTQEQLTFRRVWEETRTDILNNGNNQLRAAQDELSMYTITANKFSVNLITKGKDNG